MGRWGERRCRKSSRSCERRKELREEEGYDGTDEGIAGARVSEQEAVKEAVKEAMEEGLLQPHEIPPNLKQDYIFRI